MTTTSVCEEECLHKNSRTRMDDRIREGGRERGREERCLSNTLCKSNLSHLLPPSLPTLPPSPGTRRHLAAKPLQARAVPHHRPPHRLSLNFISSPPSLPPSPPPSGTRRHLASKPLQARAVPHHRPPHRLTLNFLSSPPSLPPSLPQELADIWWQNHFKRELSLIAALFTGQYKTTTACPTCK